MLVVFVCQISWFIFSIVGLVCTLPVGNLSSNKNVVLHRKSKIFKQCYIFIEEEEEFNIKKKKTHSTSKIFEATFFIRIMYYILWSSTYTKFKMKEKTLFKASLKKSWPKVSHLDCIMFQLHIPQTHMGLFFSSYLF